MKPVSYKRIFAYLIDIFLVTIVATLLTMFLPMSDVYTEKTNELSEVMNAYTNKEIDEAEYLERVNEISYVVNKESIAVSIVSVVLSTIYFVVIAYYMNGQTLGKKLMKLQIVSNTNSSLTMNHYLLRSLLVDSILMNTISIFAILFLEKDLYLKAYDIISTLFGGVYIVTFAMILFRNDGRGLHDLLAKTKVISLEKEPILNAEKEHEEDSKKEIIKDAEIIGK